MRSSVVELSESDRALLTSWTRSSTVSAGRVERARIVLAVADGGVPMFRVKQHGSAVRVREPGRALGFGAWRTGRRSVVGTGR